MIIGIFFEDRIVQIKKINQDIDKGHTLINNGHQYRVLNNPISFELGFYNWIIQRDQLVGINYIFNNKILSSKFSDKKFDQIILNEDEVFILFEEATDYFVDREDRFLNLFLLDDDNGSFALTFDLPYDIEYHVPELIKDAKEIKSYFYNQSNL